MWKRTDDSKIVTDDEVKKIIEALPHKVFYISGPTKSGKTPLIRSLQAKDKFIISSETFVEEIIDIFENEDAPAIDIMMSAFGTHSLLCIEDADIKLGGRKVTQEFTSNFLIKYLEKGTAVFTGIKLESNLFFITKSLEKDSIIIFESVE